MAAELPTPPRWFLHAQTFERAGIMEVKGEEAHPTIISFFNYTTLKGNKLAKSDETAWCSAFVCAMLEQCGIKSTKSAAARSWLTWGDGLEFTGCKLGAVIVVKRIDLKNPKAAHVGFYAGHVTDKQFAMLGGNQNNKVCTKLFPYSDILAVRYPIGE